MPARHSAATTTDECLKRDEQGACEGERGFGGTVPTLCSPEPHPSLSPQTVAAPCTPTTAPACPTAPHTTTAVPGMPPLGTPPVSVPAATRPATPARATLPTTARPARPAAPSRAQPTAATVPPRAPRARWGCTGTWWLSPCWPAAAWCWQGCCTPCTAGSCARAKESPAGPRRGGQSDTSLGTELGWCLASQINPLLPFQPPSPRVIPLPAAPGMVPPRVQLGEGTAVVAAPTPLGTATFPERGRERCALSHARRDEVGHVPKQLRQELDHEPAWLPAEATQTPSKVPNSCSPAALGFKKGVPGWLQPPPPCPTRTGRGTVAAVPRHTAPVAPGRDGTGRAASLGPSRGHQPRARTLGRWFVSPAFAWPCHPQHSVFAQLKSFGN